MNNIKRNVITFVILLLVITGALAWCLTNVNSGISEAGHTTQINSDWNATSGTPNILNKPSLPAAQVNSDWNSASGISHILNKPTTLPGYGITDAYPLSGNPSSFLTAITSGQIISALGYTPMSAIYSTYQANLSQSGTGNPTGTQLTNNFAGGNTFTWARTGIGTYTVTASSAVFTVNKTKVFFGPLNNALGYISYTNTSTTVITINTSVTSILSLILTTANADAMMTNMPIDIRVYP